MGPYILLDSISSQQIFETCLDLKHYCISIDGVSDFEALHYWSIGRTAYYKLQSLSNDAINDKNQTLFNMEIRINYNEPYLLSIERKPRPKYWVNLNTCYPSIDTSGFIKGANAIKKGFENMFSTLRKIEIMNVIFNEPTTIVIWSDGTKTVVKAQNGEMFDREKGLAMTICKKAFGNTSNYNEVFKKWVPED